MNAILKHWKLILAILLPLAFLPLPLVIGNSIIHFNLEKMGSFWQGWATAHKPSQENLPFIILKMNKKYKHDIKYYNPSLKQYLSIPTGFD